MLKLLNARDGDRIRWKMAIFDEFHRCKDGKTQMCINVTKIDSKVKIGTTVIVIPINLHHCQLDPQLDYPSSSTQNPN